MGQCGKDCNANQGRNRCLECDDMPYPLTACELWQFRAVLAVGAIILACAAWARPTPPCRVFCARRV